MCKLKTQLEAMNNYDVCIPATFPPLCNPQLITVPGALTPIGVGRWTIEVFRQRDVILY